MLQKQQHACMMLIHLQHTSLLLDGVEPLQGFLLTSCKGSVQVLTQTLALATVFGTVTPCECCVCLRHPPRPTVCVCMMQVSKR